MKKIIYAVMMLGMVSDVSAVKQQRNSASEERQVSFARLKTVDPALVDNVNSTLKTLSEQNDIWLFGKKIPSQCGTLRNILNREISETKRTLEKLDFFGKAELSDIKPEVESQIAKIQEQWKTVSRTPVSDEGKIKVLTAINVLIDAANSLADIIEVLETKATPVLFEVVVGKEILNEDEAE